MNTEKTRYTLEEVMERISEEESPESLAAQFSILGITGVLEDETSCPVANLVYVVTDATEVCVDDRRVDMVRGYGYDAVSVRESMPIVGSLFVEKFDGGFFPELEKKEWREDNR